LRPTQRRVATLALAAMALGMGGIDPPPALAFPLSSCTLAVTSLNADGVEVDSADSGESSAGLAAPLQVTWDGTITWSGDTDASVIRDSSWHVEVFGIPTPMRGGDPNSDGTTSAQDSIRISQAVPFRFTGLFHVSGQLSGNGGSCSGEGWVRVIGDPMSTMPFLVALALVLLGVVLLAVGARGGWPPAMVGGLLLGLGSTLLLVIYGVLPLGAALPPVVTVLGLLAGLVTGWFGRRQLRRPGGGALG
jgi:hypothetical protein